MKFFMVIGALLCLLSNPDRILGQDDDVDSLIGDVFGGLGSLSSPPPPTLDHSGCKCVPFYLCDNGTINVDGKNLIDIRSRGECEDYLETCCDEPLDPVSPQVIKPEHTTKLCGQRHEDGVGFRITNDIDNEAQFGEFPWMVLLLKLDKKTKEFTYHCGGALIHKHVILTAAHCVHKKEPCTFKARAGEWDIKTESEVLEHQDRYVDKIIVHENYHAGGLYNDVALVFTKEPFEYSENVNTICLPKQGDHIVSEDCIASGWGKDSYGKEGVYQAILKKIFLPTVPRDKCECSIKEIRGPKFRLHSSFMCAGGVPGKDTCKGDGGSPLICPIPGHEGQYQQVGIVAWGINCGTTTPAVYADVTQYRNWIDHHMTLLNYSKDYLY